MFTRKCSRGQRYDKDEFKVNFFNNSVLGGTVLASLQSCCHRVTQNNITRLDFLYLRHLNSGLTVFGSFFVMKRQTQ